MKTYSNEEIDELIKDVQDQFMQPLFKAAQEEVLAKAESGKQMPAAKEGGNGTVPVKASMKSDGGGPRSAAMMKEESPMAKEADDEAPKADASPAASDGASDSSSASAPAASASPDAPAGEASAPAADPAAADGMDPSMDPAAAAGASDPGADLQQAYGQLPDEDLKAHFEAIKTVIMSRMGGQDAGMDPAAAGAGAPPVAAPADPMGAPPAAAAAAAPDMSAGGPPPPPVAAKAAPTMSAAPAMPPVMGKSEVAQGEELAKTEERLQKQIAGLTQVIETLLVPQRKSVTSMAQFLAKSESERAEAPKLNAAQVRAKLTRASLSPTLEKSDRDLINRYILEGSQAVQLEEIEHLLK